jgi:hypothetical protein
MDGMPAQWPGNCEDSIGNAKVYINRTGEDYVDRKNAEPWRLTCPQYYYCSPFVQSVYHDLQDYEAGRLGDSLALPAPYLEYLRVLSVETERWNKYWDFEINIKPYMKK